MIPLRLIFRSRWAALAWAAGICWTAASFVGDRDPGTVDAAGSRDDTAAQAGAALAEDDG